MRNALEVSQNKIVTRDLDAFMARMAAATKSRLDRDRLAKRVSGEPRFLTTDEVADLVRTPTETVRYWRHVGKGPKSFKVGRRVLYAIEDVEAWIDAARSEKG